MIHLFHMDAALRSYQAAYQQWGVWVILVKGLTPIPYKLVTIASGLFGFALLPFALASLVTRAARFFLEAALLQHPKAKAFVDAHLVLLLVLAAVSLVAAIVALKFL